MVSYIKEFVIQRFVISRLHSAVVNNNWKFKPLYRGPANWIIFYNLSLFSIFLAFSFSDKYHFIIIPSKVNTFHETDIFTTLKGVKLLLAVSVYFIVCMNSNFWTKSVHWSSFSSLVFPTGYSCQYRYDSQAFLFSLVNKPGWAPVKLPQTGKYSYYNVHSIYDCSSHGPIFGGGHDIYIADYASSNTNSRANLGYTYSPPSGYNYGSTFSQTFLEGGSNYNFTPDEVETFYETT